MSKEIQKINWEIIANLFPQIAYKIEIPSETKDKINDIKKILNEKPTINIVAYFNHISHEDPLFAGHIIKKIDPKNTRTILIPVSYSHTDKTKKENKFSIKMIEIANSCGVDTIRTIQKYQTEDPNPIYTTKEAMVTWENLFKQIKKYKMSKKPFIYAIAPEGHRSETGILGRAENSLAKTVDFIKPCLVIPIGIHYPNTFHRDKLNFGKKVVLTIGNLYLNENKENKDIDFYMNNLALALPPQMRGKYNQTKID